MCPKTVTKTNRRLLEILHRYLDAIALTRRPGTSARYRSLLFDFLRFLQANHPKVETFSDLTRRHLEGWLRHEATRKGQHKDSLLRNATRRNHAILLRRFLEDLRAWGWEEGLPEDLIHRSDLPRLDHLSGIATGELVNGAYGVVGLRRQLHDTIVD